MKILVKLYTLWVLIVFSVFMIVLLPGIMIPLLLGPKFSRIGYFFLWLWSWIFSMLTFIRYDLRGRENIQKKTSYIYVSNHTSFLDIPGIRLLIPGEFRPIAKKELLKIPVFGFIVRAATVVVDRSNAQSRKQSIEKLRDILKGGTSILVFAEGTQNRTKEILQPFKDGAFRIAIDTQLPIIPLVVIGAGPLMPPGKMDIKPGNIKVVAGEPISVEGLITDDVQTLKQKTFETMLAIYKRNSL
ncbi:MAG TPA: lysophospholipid acyltransferase family protein [Cyclobacteriaceae bacterium]|nr:1-acyl-sn-glycerol-3-phosphate acyltransferase [Cyclobacteriaceae bacterium]HMV09747.1 lysophospholipid acyltransferase family protein [Cyclobacteriaceae bacterium]HMV88806.1 lysophospholipid acyltransferase family protein [Cyclobacteriaceae bacterium]HMX02300.1 lysophospholipid acyltransferase family protein [Cyclobacteriaceae bacterium]HMX51159.1 lysophospholipid acyltransferase family protein [Cyclobacteriaceae bacterium]